MSQLIALISGLTALVAAIAAVLHSLGVGRTVSRHLAKHRTGNRQPPMVDPAAARCPELFCDGDQGHAGPHFNWIPDAGS